MNKRKEIGKTVKQLRTENGFSMSEIAKMAGITRSQFASVEKSSANYTIDTLLMAADALNCQVKIEPKFKCIICEKPTCDSEDCICEFCLKNEKF